MPSVGHPIPSFPHPPSSLRLPREGGLGRVRAHLRDALARCRELQGRDQLCDVLPSQLVPTLVAVQMGKDTVARRDRSLGGKASTVITVSCTPASGCAEPVTPSSYSYCKRCSQTSNKSVRWLPCHGDLNGSAWRQPRGPALRRHVRSRAWSAHSSHPEGFVYNVSLKSYNYTVGLPMRKRRHGEMGDQGRDHQGAQQMGTALQNPDIAAAQRPTWEQSG